MTSTLRVDRWETSAGDGVVDATVAALGRNLLYNGAMQVAQRGTSSTGVTTGYNTADRWGVQAGNIGSWNQTVVAEVPTGSGFANSLKMTCATADSSPAAGDYLLIEQKLEGQDLQALKKGSSSAESLTLSFWVRSDITGTYVAELYDNDNTRSISATYTVSSADTWEYKTLTFAGDTTGVLDNDNAFSFRLVFWLAAGSTYSDGTLQTTWGAVTTANRAAGQVNLASAVSNYWQVTGVQLEAGTVATSFEHKAYGTELAECQRYYQRISSWSGIGEGTTAIAANANLITPLRASGPTVAVISGSTLSWRTTSASDGTTTSFGITAPTVGVNSVWVLFTGLTGISDNQAYTARNIAGTTQGAVLQVDSEL